HAEAPSRSHDRPKATWLDASARPWLTQLGLLAGDGRVRASMADKHHQLERFLEIMEHLVRDCGWKPGDRVTVADMGSGKGYLTFGLWHLLAKHLQLDAIVRGIEARAELVNMSSSVARAVGAS